MSFSKARPCFGSIAYWMSNTIKCFLREAPELKFLDGETGMNYLRYSAAGLLTPA